MQQLQQQQQQQQQRHRSPSLDIESLNVPGGVGIVDGQLVRQPGGDGQEASGAFHSVTDALDAIGFGKFQALMVCYTGGAWFAGEKEGGEAIHLRPHALQ